MMKKYFLFLIAGALLLPACKPKNTPGRETDWWEDNNQGGDQTPSYEDFHFTNDTFVVEVGKTLQMTTNKPGMWWDVNTYKPIDAKISSQLYGANIAVDTTGLVTGKYVGYSMINAQGRSNTGLNLFISQWFRTYSKHQEFPDVIGLINELARHNNYLGGSKNHVDSILGTPSNMRTKEWMDCTFTLYDYTFDATSLPCIADGADATWHLTGIYRDFTFIEEDEYGEYERSRKLLYALSVKVEPSETSMLEPFVRDRGELDSVFCSYIKAPIEPITYDSYKPTTPAHTYRARIPYVQNYEAGYDTTIQYMYRDVYIQYPKEPLENGDSYLYYYVKTY